MDFKKYFAMGIIVLFVFSSVSSAQTGTETPKGSDMINNLSQGCVVFLCFYNETDPSILAVKSEINSVVNNFQGSAAAVYVNGSDKAEDNLRTKFDVQPEQTVVFIVSPSGRTVAKMDSGRITKENLMRGLYSSCGGGRCGSGCKKGGI